MCVQKPFQLSLGCLKVLIVKILGRFIPRYKFLVQVGIPIPEAVPLFAATKVPDVLFILYLILKSCLKQNVWCLIFESVSCQQMNVRNFAVLRRNVVLEFPLVNVKLLRLKLDLVIFLNLLDSIRRVTKQIQKLVNHHRIP